MSAAILASITRAGLLPLARSISAEHHVHVEKLCGRGRTKSVAAARNHLYLLVHHNRPDMSLAEIGRAFGRDHTTIMYAVRRLERQLQAQYEGQP